MTYSLGIIQIDPFRSRLHFLTTDLLTFIQLSVIFVVKLQSHLIYIIAHNKIVIKLFLFITLAKQINYV